MLPGAINSAGLALDIVGVIMLFFYGLPEEVNRTGSGYLRLKKTDEEEAKKWKTYKIKILFGALFSCCWISASTR